MEVLKDCEINPYVNLGERVLHSNEEIQVFLYKDMLMKKFNNLKNKTTVKLHKGIYKSRKVKYLKNCDINPCVNLGERVPHTEEEIFLHKNMLMKKFKKVNHKNTVKMGEGILVYIKVMGDTRKIKFLKNLNPYVNLGNRVPHTKKKYEAFLDKHKLTSNCNKVLDKKTVKCVAMKSKLPPLQKTSKAVLPEVSKGTAKRSAKGIPKRRSAKGTPKRRSAKGTAKRRSKGTAKRSAKGTARKSAKGTVKKKLSCQRKKNSNFERSFGLELSLHKPNSGGDSETVAEFKASTSQNMQEKSANPERQANVSSKPVLEVCANHCVPSNMGIVHTNNINKAWTGVTQDFADKELHPEHFFIDFKTPEITVDFKTAFGKDINISKETVANKIASPQLASTVTTSPLPQKPFGDKLLCAAACEAKKPGSQTSAATSTTSTVTTTSAVSVFFPTTTTANVFSSVTSTNTESVCGGFTFSSNPIIQEAESSGVKDKGILVVSTISKNGPEVLKVNTVVPSITTKNITISNIKSPIQYVSPALSFSKNSAEKDAPSTIEAKNSNPESNGPGSVFTNIVSSTSKPTEFVFGVKPATQPTTFTAFSNKSSETVGFNPALSTTNNAPAIFGGVVPKTESSQSSSVFGGPQKTDVNSIFGGTAHKSDLCAGLASIFDEATKKPESSASMTLVVNKLATNTESTQNTSIFGGLSEKIDVSKPVPASIRTVSKPETSSTLFPVVTTTSQFVLNFGSASQNKDETGSVEFQFGSSQAYEFNFSGVKPCIPTKTPKSCPRSQAAPSDVKEDEENESFDADNIYFQPVISLPPEPPVLKKANFLKPLFYKLDKVHLKDMEQEQKSYEKEFENDFMQILKKMFEEDSESVQNYSDLLTVNKKLHSSEYQTVWQIIKDLHKVFQDQDGKVGRLSSEYLLMQQNKVVFSYFVFEKNILKCCTDSHCFIFKNMKNLSGGSIVCEECFYKHSTDEVAVEFDDSDLLATSFDEMKNDYMEPHLVVCFKCKRRFHAVPVLHMESKE